MPSCQIIFPPDLGIDPQDFVQYWNADHEAQTLARAEAQADSAQQYISPETMVIVLGFLGGMVGTVATTAVQDVTKRLIAAWWEQKKPEKPAPEFELLEKKLDDGSTLLVVVPKI